MPVEEKNQRIFHCPAPGKAGKNFGSGLCLMKGVKSTDGREWGAEITHPSFFSTSVPDVTQIRENEDGTFTLTVDAVCQMILCNDAVITHELTIRCLENGGIQYLGNQILDDGMRNIPEYQYRTGK